MTTDEELEQLRLQLERRRRQAESVDKPPDLRAELPTSIPLVYYTPEEEQRFANDVDG